MADRICVYGAGAIGGFLAASLARAGADVVAVTRGAQLDAIRRAGITVVVGGTRFTATPAAEADTAAVGPVDLVIVTLKGHSLPAAAPAIARLLGPDTAVAFVQNGIPWWYGHGFAPALPPALAERLDPGGAIAAGIGPERAIGGVAYCATTVVAPGQIKLDHTNIRFEFGEPSGASTARLDRLVTILTQAGVPSHASGRIRERIWGKLVLNLATGPLTVLSQSPIGALFRVESGARTVESMLDAAVSIARGLGFAVEIDRADTLAKLAASGHKPSILQDLEAGRPMEIDALYAVPIALARAAGLSVPLLETMVALVQLRARAAGLYPAEGAAPP